MKSNQKESKIIRGCECPDCGIMNRCTKSNAPVIKLVERNGKRLKVCSRCDLYSDKLIKWLITKNSPFQEYFDYDPLVIGAVMCEPQFNK